MPARDFDEKGFLSDYVYEHREAIREKYAGGFSNCERISNQAQTLLLKTGVRDNDSPSCAHSCFSKEQFVHVRPQFAYAK